MAKRQGPRPGVLVLAAWKMDHRGAAPSRTQCLPGFRLNGADFQYGNWKSQHGGRQSDDQYTQDPTAQIHSQLTPKWVSRVYFSVLPGSLKCCKVC